MPKRNFSLPADNGIRLIDPKTGNPKTISSIPLICERIRFYRDKRRIDQRDMASRLGITGNSISNWETGRSRPDVNLLPAICEVLDITLNDLFGIESSSANISDKQKELIRKYESLSSGHQFVVDKLIDNLSGIEESEAAPDLKRLMYFSRSLAAGIGDPTEFEEDALPVYVYATPESEQADSIFRVNGDSMEPYFSDGQDVLVQRLGGCSGLSFGEIGAFIVGNETYIKKYEKDGLYSFNPRYPAMHFDNEQSVYLIGRVLGVLDPSGYAKQEDIERYKLLHK